MAPEGAVGRELGKFVPGLAGIIRKWWFYIWNESSSGCKLGLRFACSGFSQWEPKSEPRRSQPAPCPPPTEAQESSLLEERQPPGATGTMAGGQLGEAPWLPPPGLPVPEHPQVSRPPPRPRPPTLWILGT